VVLPLVTWLVHVLSFSLRRHPIYTRSKNSKTLTNGRQQVCKQRPIGAWSGRNLHSGLENGRLPARSRVVTQWIMGQSTSFATPLPLVNRAYTISEREDIGREVTVERVVGWEFYPIPSCLGSPVCVMSFPSGVWDGATPVNDLCSTTCCVILRVLVHFWKLTVRDNSTKIQENWKYGA